MLSRSPTPRRLRWLEMGAQGTAKSVWVYGGRVHGIALRERCRSGLRGAAGSRVSVEAPSGGRVGNSCLHAGASVSVWGLFLSFANFSVSYLHNSFGNYWSL